MSAFSLKRENPHQPMISPRRVVAPRQFSNLIQQVHHRQSTYSPSKSPLTGRKELGKSISTPVTQESPMKTVPTLDILYPNQKQVVTALSKPKSRPNSATTIKPTSTQKVKSKSIPTVVRAPPSYKRKNIAVQELEEELIQRTKTLQKLQIDFEQVIPSPTF